MEMEMQPQIPAGLVPQPQLPPMVQPGSRGRRDYSRLLYILAFFIIFVVLVVGFLLYALFPPSFCGMTYYVGGKGVDHYHTISAAVKAVDTLSYHRTCIMIPEGNHTENIYVGADNPRIALIGVGVGLTVISAMDSQQPTLRVYGKEFIAQDLTITSTNIYQPVLVNGAPHTIFYNCSLDGSVLIKSKVSQFYRDCRFQGGDYLISGAGRAFFQSNTIYALKRNSTEVTVISGQLSGGLYDTGFVFDRCTFYTRGFVSVPNTYLAAAADSSSLTVVMHSFLDSSIAGWLVDKTTSPTVYFGEYENTGPGSSDKNASSSSSIHILHNSTEASRFSVSGFIPHARNWIPKHIPITY